MDTKHNWLRDLQNIFFRHSWKMYDHIYGEHGVPKASKYTRWIYETVFTIDRLITNLIIRIWVRLQ